jgi:membrane associated rhomboid family serine protease
MTTITVICAEYSLLVSERARQPPVLDPPMVPFAVAGTGVWAVIGLIMLVAGAPDDWLWTCLAGFLLGLVGLAFMVLRDRHRRQRP